MRFPTLSGLWRSRPDRRPAHGRPAGARPAVEALEDRSVPAIFTAANAAELIADITAANSTSEPDTITLVPGKTFTLSAVDNYTAGRNGLPVIAANENLTIVGNGDIIERSSVAGTPAFRLFAVEAGGSLTLADLTLQGGLALGQLTRDEWSQGGGIYNQGDLTLRGVTVQHNTAQGAAGGPIGFGGFAGPNRGMGGGVFSGGTLTVTGSTIQNNMAIGGNGLTREGDPIVTQSGPSSPSLSDGADGLGGGVYLAGGAGTMRSSTITGNTAKGGAAGAHGAKGVGRGGGIFIAPEALVYLDGTTVKQLKGNHASSSNNIAGTYIPV